MGYHWTFHAFRCFCDYEEKVIYTSSAFDYFWSQKRHKPFFIFMKSDFLVHLFVTIQQVY